MLWSYSGDNHRYHQNKDWTKSFGKLLVKWKTLSNDCCKRQYIRLGDLRILKKAYNLCRLLSLMIEDIFGWGIVYLTVLRLGSSMFQSHTLYKEIAKGRINFKAIVPLFMNIVEIFIPATTCRKCVDTTKLIVHSAFSINLPAFHVDVEDFVRQTMHQRIKFEPKTFFVINQELVVGVSIIW